MGEQTLEHKQICTHTYMIEHVHAQAHARTHSHKHFRKGTQSAPAVHQPTCNMPDHVRLHISSSDHTQWSSSPCIATVLVIALGDIHRPNLCYGLTAWYMHSIPWHSPAGGSSFIIMLYHLGLGRCPWHLRLARKPEDWLPILCRVALCNYFCKMCVHTRFLQYWILIWSFSKVSCFPSKVLMMCWLGFVMDLSSNINWGISLSLPPSLSLSLNSLWKKWPGAPMKSLTKSLNCCVRYQMHQGRCSSS